MAHDNGLAPRLVASELGRMAKRSLDALPGLVQALENEGAERAMLLRVRDVVARQAAQAMRVAPLVPKVDRNLF